MPMSGDALSPVTVHGAYVTSGYMAVLGIRPSTGRFFAPDENIVGSPAHVAVISHRLWQRVFGSDPAVVGRTLSINRQPTTIIGIAPRGFDGPDLNSTDVWMPFASYPASSTDGSWYNSFFSATGLRLVGRVATGTMNEWITSAATTVVRRTRVEGVRGYVTNALRDTAAVMLLGPILESLGPSIKPAPEMGIAKRLVGVTIIVLLIACANVASLLLARSLGRRREIAVRIALGVSRPRLIAQLLCEGLLLAATAGIAALVVSVWAGSALRGLIMPDTYWADSAFDGRVILFTGILALGTGLLAGLVPALQASRPELSDTLKSGTRDSGAGASKFRLRQLLLVAQVAMSVMLLYGAALFVHSLMRLRAIDTGFDSERVIYASVYLLDPSRTYIDWGTSRLPRVSRGLSQTARRLASAPGIEQVAVSDGGPMGWNSTTRGYLPDGRSLPLVNDRDPVGISATPNYLEATGTRLVRGRFFNISDRDGPPVVVVSETAARSYWPGGDALGQCLRLASRTAPCSTVIGIVRDSPVYNVLEQPVAQLITPFEYDSLGTPRGASSLIVRTKPGQTATVRALLHRELAAVFPSTSAVFIKSVSDSMEREMRPWRVGLLLFGGFGILALVIAALGTYSVLSYTVTQRLHEIGVRIALGARTLDVLRLVVSQGLRLAMIGVAIGLVVALGASRVMQSLLYDTSPREPTVTLGVAALLVAIAAAASAIPARRAASVDPVEVLRAE
jgi:predicted permease